jgi:hypothetical protein
VLLAEDFGSAEVVPRTEFARTLKSGRPVLIGVVPANGDLSRGHEVVLSKTFQQAGETWFEMIDSNHDHPLYLSNKELGTILLERGVGIPSGRANGSEVVGAGTEPEFLQQSVIHSISLVLWPSFYAFPKCITLSAAERYAGTSA